MPILVEDTKYDDLNYCYSVLDALKALEENNTKRENLNQTIQNRTQYKSNFGKLASLLLIPLIMVFTILFSRMWSVPMILLIIILLIESLVYILGMIWWKKFGEAQMITLGQKEYKQELSRIDEKSINLLNHPPLVSLRIADKYLSIDSVTQLIGYLQKRHASFLEEAVYMMELDIKNTKYGKKSLVEDNIFQKEKKYITKRQEKVNVT
ncbi:hypothetical protein [Lactococcus allomyrinae]|uniref:Uncharacterized protein n=1 Tax=Lactococcus allomyrinae TaxID=2419773 RepID=A0A387BAW5_9LACT|nr:hypothetical protein [Lactococcus allomyrinae]AYG00893.1 hypothetical protein D7I46_07160 [Lactococcus allomyrinae]